MGTRERDDDLVGRESDVRATLEAASSASGLVTLVGPPGVGKTRLALEAARVLSAGKSVQLLALSGTRSREEVQRAVDARVRARRGAAHDRHEDLEAWISGAGAVVVLDGAEGVLGPVREALEPLLASGLGAPVLVTSAERLGVPGERVVVVSPLSIAPASEGGGDATELFLKRARAVHGAEEPSPLASAAASTRVSEIVARLGGSPLVLEAAAAELGIMSVEALAERLETTHEGPCVLVSRGPLRASIARAVDLLSASAREALHQCAVFEGSFRLGDAEAIVELTADDGRGPGVVEAVRELRERWLLSNEVVHGEARLRLDAAVRWFVLADASAAETLVGARARHARHFGALARRVDAEGLSGPRFGEPSDFLVAAHELLKGPGRRQAAELETVVAMLALAFERAPATLRVDSHRGHPQSLPLVLDELLARTRETHARKLECRALILRSRIAQFSGHARAALADAEAAVELARTSRSSELRGLALQRIGSLRMDAGDAQTAVTVLKRAVTLLETGRGRWHVAALNTLATAEMARGDTTAARAHFVDALARRERAGDQDEAGPEHAGIAATLFQEGRLTDAVLAFDRAIDHFRRAGTGGAGYALAGRALAAQELGRFDEARRDLGTALETFRSAGNRRFERVFAGYLAQVHHEAADLESAEAVYREAIRLLRSDEQTAYEGLFTASLAALLASRGGLDEAAFLLDDIRSRTMFADGSDPRAKAVSVHGGHVALARARDARSRGEDPTPHFARAKERLALAAGGRTSDDVRFAERLLAREITLTETSSGREDLVIGRDTASFRLGPRAPVDLRRKRSTRLMLRALVDARRETPGSPLSVDVLIAATWPGERILPHAAVSRAYVTVLMLRNLGLRGVLVQRDGGYMLDPDVPLVVDA